MAWTPTIWKPRLLPTLLLIAALSDAVVHAQEGGQKPAPSAPPAATTNSATSPSQKSALERFRDNLFAPSDPYGPKNGVTSLMELPKRRTQPFTAPDERTRQKMDQEQNWMINGMNELNSPSSPEKLLGLKDFGSDGLEKKKLSPVEQYYQNLDSKSQRGTNRTDSVGEILWNLKQLSGTNGFNSMSAYIPGDSDLLGGTLLPPASDASRNDNGMSPDFRASRDAASALAAEHEQKKRLDNFKRLMDPSLPPPPVEPGSAESFHNLLTPTPILAPGSLVTAPTPYQGALAPVQAAIIPSGNFYSQPTAINSGANWSGDNARKNLSDAPKPSTLFQNPFEQNLPKRKF